MFRPDEWHEIVFVRDATGSTLNDFTVASSIKEAAQKLQQKHPGWRPIKGKRVPLKQVNRDDFALHMLVVDGFIVESL